MRIIVAHNFYSRAHSSGENSAVEAEVALLRGAGHEVRTLYAESDDYSSVTVGGKRQLARAALGGSAGLGQLEDLLQAGPADVLHVHNVYPGVGPRVIPAARRLGMAVVHTVHNYRHTCLNGLHFRDGGFCTDCLRRSDWSGVRHGCFRNSVSQSLVLASSRLLHARAWDSVHIYVALTPYAADRLVDAGVPRGSIRISPGWSSRVSTNSEPGSDLLFVGRLEASKGPQLLLRAWLAAPSRRQLQRLVFVGDGPLRPELERRAAADPSVVFAGMQSQAGVKQHLERAGAVAVPSITPEGFPLVIAEAWASGRGVMVPAGGSPASMLGAAGWILESRVDAWSQQIASLDRPEVLRAGATAKANYQAMLSPTVHLQRLISLYGEAAVAADASRS